MEDELKEIYQRLQNYLGKRWKKIVGWIVFIFHLAKTGVKETTP